MSDPVSGPLTRDELRALTDAPFGEAAKVIRKHDPLFGRAPGEKLDWLVVLEVSGQARCVVTACSEAEARELALDSTAAEIDFTVIDDIEIYSIEVDS